MFPALIQLPVNLQTPINMHATSVYCPLTNQMRIALQPRTAVYLNLHTISAQQLV